MTNRFCSLILFSTLGCLFELYQNTHMDALSVGLGFTGLLRIVFSLSPLIVAIPTYLWLGMKCRRGSLSEQMGLVGKGAAP